MPPDWGGYRAQWETGHVIAAMLSILALAALIRAWLIERDRHRQG